MDPQLFLITGIMAAGKSSVAQALANKFDRSVHLRGDMFRRSVVNGRAEMTAEPSDEALAQLRLRYELAAQCADRYVAGGFVTVLQDVVVGSWLTKMVELITTRPLALVVLVPTAEQVTQREETRRKTGYTSFTPAEFDAHLRATTPRLGLWVDSSNLTVEETVSQVIANLDEALVR